MYNRINRKLLESGCAVFKMKQANVGETRRFVSKYRALPLPRLPVPELRHTIQLWKRSIEPLVSPEMFRRSAEVADDFVKPDGVGNTLQIKLAEHDRRLQHTSWMAEWWKERAYYRTRDSLPLNSNFFYVFENTGKAPLEQLTRAAFLTFELMNTRYQLMKEVFPLMHMNDVPQCMDAYMNLYNSCRIPKVRQDEFRYPPDQLKGLRHIVVLRFGLFFSLAVCDETGKPYSLSTIRKGLEQVCVNAERHRHEQPPVGIFTAENRDVWANIRSVLKERGGNQSNLDTIETAAFCLCLDDASPRSLDEACQLLFHGKGSDACSANRFFDKPLSIIVFANGIAGLSGEHSNIDGMMVTRVTDLVLEKEKEKHFGLLNPLKFQDDGRAIFPSRTPLPKLLNWTLDTQFLRVSLSEAKENFDLRISHIEGVLFEYLSYGQNFIRSVNLSPDGYLQMAFHLSYYRMHHKFTAVYESISTQKFLHGRTEVNRTLSKEAVDFVLAFTNMDPSVHSSVQNTYAMLKIACSAHVQYNIKALNGNGCDRHILGLQIVAEQQNIYHPFLSDPAHEISTHWRLSTSQLPSKFSVTGYGPVVPDGYGLYYNLRPNKFNFYITSFKNDHGTDAHRLKQALQTSLDEMQKLCIDAFRTEPKL